MRGQVDLGIRSLQPAVNDALLLLGRAIGVAIALDIGVNNIVLGDGDGRRRRGSATGRSASGSLPRRRFDKAFRQFWFPGRLMSPHTLVVYRRTLSDLLGRLARLAPRDGHAESMATGIDILERVARGPIERKTRRERGLDQNPTFQFPSSPTVEFVYSRASFALPGRDPLKSKPMTSSMLLTSLVLTSIFHQTIWKIAGKVHPIIHQYRM